MNYIKLNNILGLTDEEINNSKIELNMQAGVGGESYINLGFIVMKRIKKTELAQNVVIGVGMAIKEILDQVNGYLVL